MRELILIKHTKSIPYVGKEIHNCYAFVYGPYWVIGMFITCNMSPGGVYIHICSMRYMLQSV